MQLALQQRSCGTSDQPRAGCAAGILHHLGCVSGISLLCAAQRLPAVFRYPQLAAWCIDWVQSPSTPAICAVLGVRDVRTLALAHDDVLTFVTRLFVAHACMMCMCEHRDGCRVGDVSPFVTSADRQTSGALRVQEVKGHLRHEPRTCGLACTGFLRDAGTVLQVYMEHMHVQSMPDTLLFPEWAPGSMATAVPASEAAFFKSALRGLARQAGMPEELVLRCRSCCGSSCCASARTVFGQAATHTSWGQGWSQRCGFSSKAFGGRQSSRSSTGRTRRTSPTCTGS